MQFVHTMRQSKISISITTLLSFSEITLLYYLIKLFNSCICRPLKYWWFLHPSIASLTRQLLETCQNSGKSITGKCIDSIGWQAACRWTTVICLLRVHCPWSLPCRQNQLPHLALSLSLFARRKTSAQSRRAGNWASAAALRLAR